MKLTIILLFLVFSLGILIIEIITLQTPKRSIKDVGMGRIPSIPKEIVEQYKSIEPIIELSQKCCNQDPSKRPTYQQILDQLFTLK